MNSPLKFQTLFKFPGPSIPSLPFPANESNNNIIPPIPYSSLLPNMPITPKVNKNINNMAIPPPPSTFEVSPTKAIVNKVISDDKISEGLSSETTQMTEAELLAAIEMEKRNTLINTQKLSQLHDEYHLKLDELKNILSNTKQKTMIIEEMEENQGKESLQSILEQKKKVYDSYVMTQSVRLRDEQQLKVVDGQNRNLSAIVVSLNKQLMNVINQYQMMCNKQNEQSNGEYMENEQYHEQPDCSGAISNNEQFQKMLNDNRRLERQIKFLKHIIQRETERHKFNAI